MFQKQLLNDLNLGSKVLLRTIVSIDVLLREIRLIVNVQDVITHMCYIYQYLPPVDAALRMIIVITTDKDLLSCSRFTNIVKS